MRPEDDDALATEHAAEPAVRVTWPAEYWARNRRTYWVGFSSLEEHCGTVHGLRLVLFKSIGPGKPRRETPQVLADLHVQLHGCIRAIDMLKHLATCERVNWEWYETEYSASFGYLPPTRELVERYRA